MLVKTPSFAQENILQTQLVQTVRGLQVQAVHKRHWSVTEKKKKRTKGKRVQIRQFIHGAFSSDRLGCRKILGPLSVQLQRSLVARNLVYPDGSVVAESFRGIQSRSASRPQGISTVQSSPVSMGTGFEENEPSPCSRLRMQSSMDCENLSSSQATRRRPLERKGQVESALSTVKMFWS